MSTDVMQQLQLKAKANPQRVVFPEANEEKILHAVRQVQDMGIAYPILVGEPKAVYALAGSIGVSLDKITIVDHTDAGKVDQFATRYAEINPDFPASAVKRKLKDPLYFAVMMVRLDEADCMVAGLSHTTGEVIMASEMIIGLQEGISQRSQARVFCQSRDMRGRKVACWGLPTVLSVRRPILKNWPTLLSQRQIPYRDCWAGSHE